MAVSIRLARQGAKQHPQYLIVAIDRQRKRDGVYLEKLGYYFPKAKTAKEKVKVNVENVRAWQAKGAQVSETVKQLLKEVTK
ncbi:MAG: 30S ribosomal protein S16 [Deltaproteobacteria bacterium]|nr:30S ribosomal protein S16 [Deltaproteobacteria bacterium]MBI4925363.1 30S ribosomal protein S16 [Bdellovibrio sp.]